MTKRLKFEKPESGEWVQPVRKAYKQACCDCGLVHSVHFRVQNGRAQFKVYRDEKLTRKLRKQDRITVKYTRRK